MVDQDVSIKKIALKFNYNEASMYRIIKRYKLHGIDGILHKADSNKFSVEFKINELLYETSRKQKYKTIFFQ